MIWFTSDTHYGHKKVIEYCNRPFAGVDEMDEALIARWNALVSPDDHVYHLGDFAMGPDLAARTKALRKQLKGKITLILGNHDRTVSFAQDAGFDEVLKVWTGELDGLKVWMRHHPPARPEGWCGEYDLLLCGHVHEKWLHHGKVVNVGVDQWGYAPVTLNELLFVAREGRRR